jgi:hypothetical protein
LTAAPAFRTLRPNPRPRRCLMQTELFVFAGRVALL